MSYSAKFKTRVPAPLYRIACAIAKALDNDQNGERNYGPEIRQDDAGIDYIPAYYESTVPCTPDFADQALVLIAQPEMLHATVAQAYADRWPDLVPPTLAECQAFCAGVVVVGNETEALQAEGGAT